MDIPTDGGVLVIKGQPKKGTEIQDLCHPNYNEWLIDWRKFRSVWEGGRQFIDTYLAQYSTRENADDFKIRKDITYCPGHARTAVLETKNSIYERFIDLSREGGTQKYKDWVAGLKGGIDGTGITMNKFIGMTCLPELLVTSRVGVFVDAPKTEAVTLRDSENFMPYAYMYRAEDIRTWARKDSNSDLLTAVLLRDSIYTYDDDLGLISGTESRFRLVTKKMDSNDKPYIQVRYYNAKGEEVTADEDTINIPEIPFDFVELDHSILKDVADHQIALLNLASSDLNYCMKANFPFYTEEFDPKTELDTFVNAGDDWSDNKDGSQAKAKESDVKTAEVGPMNGRRYPKGTQRPQFIHPSADPLKASMKKQEEIRTEIRQLVLLSVSSLSPDAIKTDRDDQGLEAGLSFIGMTLETLERRIARIFALYENPENPNVATIKYPTDYRIRSDKDRREEADQLMEIMPKIPSTTYQKEVSKRVADLTMGHWISESDSKTIDSEINTAKIIVTDPKVLLEDLEKGLVSEETASEARLYPKGEIEKARKDHAERIARIQQAQASNKLENPAARGVDDLSVDKDEAVDEKKQSQNADTNDIPKSKTRGDAK